MIGAVVFATAVSLASAQNPALPLEQLLTGFLTSVEPNIGGNVTACVQKSNAGFDDINKAIVLLEQGLNNMNFTAFAAAFADLKKVPQLAAVAAQFCNEPVLAMDLQNLGTEIADHPTVVLAKLAVFLPTMITDFKSFIQYFQQQMFTQAGVQLGNIMGVLIELSASDAVVSQDAPLLPLEELVSGFLTSVDPTIGGNVTACVAKSNLGFDDIDKAVVLLEQGLNNMNFTAVAAAFKDVSVIPQLAATAASLCNAPGFATKLDALGTAIADHPVETLAKLAAFLPSMITDLKSFIMYFKAMMYQQAGTQFGAAMNVLLSLA